jgi:hypothetical protein
VDLSLWTVHEWVVEVTNFVEKVDLIFARKQRRAYAVYRRVAPPLIIKSTLLVQKLYKLRVCFAPPEIEVPDLEITPD